MRAHHNRSTIISGLEERIVYFFFFLFHLISVVCVVVVVVCSEFVFNDERKKFSLFSESRESRESGKSVVKYGLDQQNEHRAYHKWHAYNANIELKGIARYKWMRNEDSLRQIGLNVLNAAFVTNCGSCPPPYTTIYSHDLLAAQMLCIQLRERERERQGNFLISTV